MSHATLALWPLSYPSPRGGKDLNSRDSLSSYAVPKKSVLSLTGLLPPPLPSPSTSNRSSNRSSIHLTASYAFLRPGLSRHSLHHCPSSGLILVQLGPSCSPSLPSRPPASPMHSHRGWRALKTNLTTVIFLLKAIPKASFPPQRPKSGTRGPSEDQAQPPFPQLPALQPLQVP